MIPPVEMDFLDDKLAEKGWSSILDDDITSTGLMLVLV